MTVTCISTKLNSTEKELITSRIRVGDAYMLSRGKSYLVISLTCYYSSSLFGNGVVYEIVDDGGRLVSVPAALFDIEDGRPSGLWRIREFDDGTFALWPEEFFTSYFHDDLSEGEPRVTELFHKIVSLMKHEFAGAE